VHPATAILVCIECGAATERFERGWRAWLTAEENEEPVEVVVLCAACSEPEFGEVTASET
jgi:hypothetical protein